mmetsp:Transcript_5446/g.10376  ORF Transcript_5446/g.10376 Transcript_5446/m.10376 type:complete len:210 (-) Transcript_5446:1796-2425(-)
MLSRTSFIINCCKFPRLCSSRLTIYQQQSNVLALSNQRDFSSISKGQDLLADSLSFGAKPKIILDSFYPNTGIDVHGMLDFMRSPSDASSEGQQQQQQKYDEERDKNVNNTLLMNGSIIAFPHICYLWKPSSAKEVTLESLSIVSLCKPSVEFLFIGCDTPLPPRELNRIKTEMRKKQIVVEQMNVMNAMGTFNVLNGEDRRIAAAIVV